MKKTAYILLIAGLILFIALIVREGIPEILTALSSVGWGLFWISVFRIIPIALDALAWSVLFSKINSPSIPTLSWARWVGESINTLLPVAQVGGNIVRAKLVMDQGVDGMRAAAIAVIELTVGLATQFIFAFLGILLLLQQGGEELKRISLISGLIIGAFVLAAFYLTQRFGLFSYSIRFLNAIVRGNELIGLAGGAKNLDIRISEMYRKHRELIVSSFWRFMSWVTKTGETWLALYFLGFPVTFQEALIVESLSSAVRISAFAVPGALGVQEGGIIIICSMIGIDSEIALALALIKRTRELFVGIPGLISWSVSESRRL
jgi:putative membrane protein